MPWHACYTLVMEDRELRPVTNALGWAGSAVVLLLLNTASMATVPDGYSVLLPPVASDPDPREIECLAQAISYESGNESVSGQEAVAQVVLNRLRAPQYPKTVCSVVYQGSARRTGCQFTFTCDGSLLRPRRAASMAAARLIAERMLRGGRAVEVADAVNYHADYVAPVWSRTLHRVTKIGAHIFYRLPDGSARLALLQSVGDLGPTRRPAVASSSPGLFAPWGVPTLTITPKGVVRAIGYSTSVAAQN